MRWADVFDARELESAFWRWQTRFTSQKELDWLRYSNAPLYEVMYEITCIVKETPDALRQAENWLVPNKLTDRS